MGYRFDTPATTSSAGGKSVETPTASTAGSHGELVQRLDTPASTSSSAGGESVEAFIDKVSRSHSRHHSV